MRKYSDAYNSALNRFVCYREAGNIVVSHCLGWKVKSAKVQNGSGGVSHEEVVLAIPFLAPDKKEFSSRVACLRTAMVVITAGDVASIIHQFEVDRGGYESRSEKYAYHSCWQFLISDLVKLNIRTYLKDPTSYCSVAVTTAEKIHAGNLRFPADRTQAHIVRALQDWKEQYILPEIERAERKAGRILHKYWPAVRDIATALHKTKSGQMGRSQLLRYLERHIESTQVSA